MNSIKTSKIADLNRGAREYLHKIWRQRGAGHPGIFIRGNALWWSVFGLLAGLLLLWVAGSGLQPDGLYGSLPWQCGVTALGTVCLAFSIHTLWRRSLRGSLGNFTYFDGTWYWEIGPHRVAVTNLTQVNDLRVLDHFRNGVWTKTVAHIALPHNERTSITFANQRIAQQFAAFLQICLGIRRQACLGQLSPSVSQFVADPAGLAQAARAVLDSGGAHVSLGRGTLIPIPDPALLRPSRPGLRRLAWQAAVGFAVFATGWVCFPPLRYSIDHRHHYLMVKSSSDIDTQWPQTYLAKFPAGRYRSEVTAILDDRLFGNASRDADKRHSPAAIRNYLAGQPNQRHQEEARRIIARFYDEAIARVQQLATGQATDQNLLSGLLAILEHLKAQATPRVTVAFQSSVSVEPEDESVKQMEQRYQSGYAERDPVIERMVNTSGTAIIGTHDTFSEKQVRRRESLILSRLRETVSKILYSDIIVFQESASKQTGDITIHYEIKPRGKLTKYVRLPETRAANFATQMAESLHPETVLHLPNTTNTLGLLREFTTEWRLTTQPGAQGTAFTYTLTSNAGSNLVYQASSGDPEWGVYAVLMHSAFYDFSNRMLSGAGLTPPPAPTTFTFHDAVNR